MVAQAISPFQPGVGTVPAFLADRDRELRSFLHALDEVPDKQYNFRVTGLRGVGKTVLIKEYEKAARNAGWLVVREEWSERYRDEPAFTRRVVTDFGSVISMLSLARRLAADAQSTLQHIKTELAWELQGGLTMRVSASAAPQTPFEDRMATAVDHMGRLALRSGRSILLLYDEAHTVRDNKNKAQLPLKTFLGAIVRAQENGLPIVLGLTGLPFLSANLRKARTHSERLFDPVELGNLTTKPGASGRPSAAALALIEPTKAGPVKFDPQIAERVAEDVDGYPYFIQKYGDDLWNAAFDAGLSVIDDSVYQSQRDAIQDDLDIRFYEGRFDDAKRADQQTLRLAGSLNDESFTMSAIQELHSRSNYRATQQSLNRLIQDGLIYRVRYGEYAYTAPRFGDFLRRKHPPGELQR
jgi:AAA ATPase domain